MDMLIGWGLILVTATLLILVIRVSGSREKPHAGCGGDMRPGSPGGGCH